MAGIGVMKAEAYGGSMAGAGEESKLARYQRRAA